MSLAPRFKKNWLYGTVVNSLLANDVNNQFDLMYRRHVQRKAFGHVVVSSGNATVAGAGDHWASRSDIVSGSWALYRLPGSGTEDLVAYHNAGESDWLFAHSPGGLYTGGSVGTTPTATDATITANYISWLGRGDGGSNPQFVLQMWASDDLTCFREAYFFNSNCMGITRNETVDMAPAGWTTPSFAIADKIGAGIISANSRVGTVDDYTFGFTGGIFKGRGPHGAMSMAATTEATNWGSTGGQLAALASTDPKETISGVYRNPSRCGLDVSPSSADAGLKGYMFDSWWAPKGIYASGDTLPTTGEKEAVVIGAQIWPWNGTAFQRA